MEVLNQVLRQPAAPAGFISPKYAHRPAANDNEQAPLIASAGDDEIGMLLQELYQRTLQDTVPPHLLQIVISGIPVGRRDNTVLRARA